MTTAELTDEIIADYGETAFRAGDLGGWNLADACLSDSPLAKRTELFAAMRARLCDRINGHAVRSGADASAVLAVALDASKAVR